MDVQSRDGQRDTASLVWISDLDVAHNGTLEPASDCRDSCSDRVTSQFHTPMGRRWAPSTHFHLEGQAPASGCHSRAEAPGGAPMTVLGQLLGSVHRLCRRLVRTPKRRLQERYPQFEIGIGTYGDDVEVLSWNEGATLRIGAYTSIAAGVKVFLGGEHRTDWVTTFPFSVLWASARHYSGHPASKGDVTIGSDVWIGNGAMILSGVHIGHGAVIGAMAVVTRDVPAYAIAAGNPARIVRFRFEKEVVDRLLVQQWWNWPESRIQRALPEMLNSDVEQFLLKAENGDYDDC